ncbi:cytochrome P450 [Cunninghamella echinulata]|nr:cytochrome P450 [Cunninghamella echinulata]
MSLSDNKVVKSFGIAGSVAAVALTYLTVKYHDRVVFYDHRENTTPKKGLPLVGNTLGLLSNLERINHYFLDCFEETKSDTISLSALGLPEGVVTCNPDNVEHVLKSVLFHNSVIDLLGYGIFNANGERWRYQRKAASLIFNVKNFRDHFTDVFVEELKLVENIFDKSIETKIPVDFHDVMYKFTLDSFVILGFGTEIGALTTEGKVPFAEAFDELQKNSFDRFMNFMEPVERRCREIFMPWKPTVASYLKTIDTFASSVIKTRRAELAAGEQCKDLLSRFMETRNENGEPLNDKELRDCIMNFIIAGRDTTAQALSWSLYNLMLYPETEKKLVQEIIDNIPDGIEQDAPKLYENIKEMKYAHAVLYESLRLYPSVPSNQKEALEADVLPSGAVLRKGDVVIWSSYALGRNKRVWGEDAEEFKPERWIKEDGSLRRETQGRWPVFHAGPRVCLGQNLATLEALVALSLLLKRYKFTLVPNQDITYQVSLTLPMKNGLKVYIEHRS